MVHYYIYFRIPAERAADVETAIHHMHLAIKEQLGINGRLLKKRDEPNLWMEVYENLPEDSGFEDVLKRVEAQTGIAELLGSNEKRHVECFKS